MAALTEDRDTAYKDGTIISAPVAANAKIYQGSGVVIDSGYAKPAASNLLNATTIGVAVEAVDNTGGANGAKSIKVRCQKVFKFDNSASNPVTQEHVNKPCFWADDHTVSANSVGPMAGIVRSVESDGVWVLMTGIDGVLKDLHDFASLQGMSSPLKDCVANSTTRTSLFAADGQCTLIGASLMFYAKPSSAAGTVLGMLKKWDASAGQEVNLMDEAVDLETLTDKEAVSLSLTETSANLVFDAGDTAYFEVTSNNEDMTGGTDGCITLSVII